MKRIFNFKFYRPLVVLFSLVLLFCTVTPCVGAFNGVVDLNDTPKSETLQSTDTPILEEGVYCISNVFTNYRLAVPGFATENGSEVRCIRDNRASTSLTAVDKNRLWWVGHISGNTYSIRPLHIINKALDVADGNGDKLAVQLYTAGISAGGALYSSRWIISQPTASMVNSGQYLLTNSGDQTKVLYCSGSGTVSAKKGGVTDYTKWKFTRLSDEQAKSLEGIVIYGDFAIAKGESTNLSVGVFSTTSMSQSVTFSKGTGYYGITVTSNGTVTGTEYGASMVKVVSNVNSSIIGKANFWVADASNRTATLVGIPSSLGNEHDHTSCFTEVETYLRGIYGSSSSIIKEQSVVDDNVVLGDISNSQVFIFRGHGLRNGIYFGDDKMNSPALFSSIVRWGTAREFANTDLVLYMCCLTGEGGVNADNLVRATYENGAKNTIGFDKEIICGDANKWIKEFMEELKIASASSGEITITKNNIKTALREIDYSLYKDLSTFDVVYIPGIEDY